MQAKKNGVAKKRARKGLRRLPTVAEERIGYAEKLMLEAIAREPENPVFVHVRELLEEERRLTLVLEDRAERRAGF
jgi:hypothetical protein